MAVNIFWSTTNGGVAIDDEVDSGSLANGSQSSGTEIFIRHDGAQNITNARFYIAPFSGTYAGGATAVADHEELLAWGDGATANAFGGFQVNMNAVGSYPSGNWPTVSSKSPTDGFVARSGVGDRSANAVLLTTNTGCTSTGVIPAGSSPNVRFKFRVAIPTDEDTAGIRMWDQVLLYTYTS